jgi:hypothetical protein
MLQQRRESVKISVQSSTNSTGRMIFQICVKNKYGWLYPRSPSSPKLLLLLLLLLLFGDGRGDGSGLKQKLHP